METPKEVRAWVKQDTLVCRHGTVYSDHFANGLVPIRIIPYPPDDPPPEWSEGTRLRGKRRFMIDAMVGPGEMHRGPSGGWRCYTDDGVLIDCSQYEPIPTTQTVTYRITGTPERLAYIAGTLDVAKGITVEVVDDA
jgi:hypothetical protein